MYTRSEQRGKPNLKSRVVDEKARVVDEDDDVTL